MTISERATQIATAAPTPATGQPHGFAIRMMESLVIPTFALDADCRVILWNRACERLTGVASYEVLGTSEHWSSFYTQRRPTLADLLVQGRSAELDALYQQQMAYADDAATLRVGNWCDMPRTGRRRYLAAEASPVYGNDGRLVAVVETLRDMTNEKTAQAELQLLATRDGLTGLANRRCFDDTLQAEWQRALRQQQALSLLMVDIDNFKQFNDTHGHLGGDECLRRVADAVASEMRANDLVARFGGEEFAVILPNQSLKGAAIVAERIRLTVEQLGQASTAGPSLFVTVSIGAATALPAPESGPDSAALLATADAALYRAKHMGRNRISLPETDLL
jgi:diguanylate cyclase (GGDEF)-like protein/PAS domain S-box-containing protein